MWAYIIKCRVFWKRLYYVFIVSIVCIFCLLQQDSMYIDKTDMQRRTTLTKIQVTIQPYFFKRFFFFKVQLYSGYPSLFSQACTHCLCEFASSLPINTVELNFVSVGTVPDSMLCSMLVISSHHKHAHYIEPFYFTLLNLYTFVENACMPVCIPPHSQNMCSEVCVGLILICVVAWAILLLR